jgi:hypothetical protein
LAHGIRLGGGFTSNERNGILQDLLSEEICGDGRNTLFGTHFTLEIPVQIGPIKHERYYDKQHPSQSQPEQGQEKEDCPQQGGQYESRPENSRLCLIYSVLELTLKRAKC